MVFILKSERDRCGRLLPAESNAGRYPSAINPTKGTVRRQSRNRIRTFND
jgi:hypothetical protein